MKCPKCQHNVSKVVDSRPVENGKAIRRRRECSNCGFRFTTFERIEAETIFVVKRSGERELFDRDKILSGILRSSPKQSLSTETINHVVDNVEMIVNSRDQKEITSEAIGQMVLSELKKIDEVAYIRFASVYNNFQSIDEFIAAVQTMNHQGE